MKKITIIITIMLMILISNRLYATNVLIINVSGDRAQFKISTPKSHHAIFSLNDNEFRWIPNAICDGSAIKDYNCTVDISITGKGTDRVAPIEADGMAIVFKKFESIGGGKMKTDYFAPGKGSSFIDGWLKEQAYEFTGLLSVLTGHIVNR